MLVHSNKHILGTPCKALGKKNVILIQYFFYLGMYHVCRYVVVELQFEDKRKNASSITESSLVQAISKSIRDLHGIHGLAITKSGLHGT